MSHPIVVDDETFDLVNRAIKEETVKDANGNPAKHKADVVKIAVAKMMNVRLVSDPDRQLISDYGFTSIEQLELYYQSIQKIPKESRGPETMKQLRSAIVENRVDEFIGKIVVSGGILKLEEF